MKSLVLSLLLFLSFAATCFSDCPCAVKKVWSHTYGSSPQSPIQRALDDIAADNLGDVIEPINYCLHPYRNPNHRRTLELFVAELTAYFVPPATGAYIFSMICDNVCALLIDGVKVAEMTSYVNEGQWHLAVNSGPLSLTKGTCVEVRSVQMEGIGRDFIDVGIEYPDGTKEQPMVSHFCSDCPCNVSSCDNGGTCVNTGNNGEGFICDCPDCYEGTTCEKEKQSCSNKPCPGDEICSFDPDEENCYKCDCPACKERDANDDCVVYDACALKPCSKNGICYNDDSNPEKCYRCEGCYDKWDVERCKALKEKLDDGSISQSELNNMVDNCRYFSDFCCPCEAGCNLMYFKMGCWSDSRNNRMFPKLLFTDRDSSSPKYSNISINWANWLTYMPELTCRCAIAAKTAGYKWFGVQFYGECWSGPGTNYTDKGVSKYCVDRKWHKCTWKGRAEEEFDHYSVGMMPDYCCCGQGNANYVYYIPSFMNVDSCTMAR